MIQKKQIDSLNILILSLFPLSFILGPSISLFSILSIGILFLITYNFREYDFIFSSTTIKILFAIYFYLLFNSIISIDYKIGLGRNLGFVRFILFFLAINFLFFKLKTDKIFKIWFFILVIVLIDSYIEAIFGKNSLGFGEEYGNRIVSFFKDEPIVAAFLNGFILMIFGYFLNNFSKYNNFKKFSIYILILLFLICILLTGERSNLIKILIGFFVFLYLIHHFSLSTKIIFTLIVSVFMLVVLSSSTYLKHRYISQLYEKIKTKEKRLEFYDKSLYVSLYKSGYAVFKNNFYLGVGNKNYRVETCDFSKEKKGKYKNYWCMTHPHQIYIEFLSEHGLGGTIILLVLFFTLIFKHLKIIITSKNYIQVGSFIYLILNFIPLLPSGSFFNDFNLSLFFLNLSIMYASNKKTNIFYKKKYNIK